jgi:hypothetical protein
VGFLIRKLNDHGERSRESAQTHRNGRRG